MAETPNATPTAAPAASPATPPSVPDTGSLVAAGEQQMQAAQSQIQSEMTAGSDALQKAQDISAQPLKSDKPVPHARLLAMVQGLADGLGAFGKSLATHGAEGGAQEVAQLRAGRQQQQIEARNSEIAQRNQQVQQQITVGDTNLRMAQMHAMMSTMPLDMAMKHLEAEKGEQALASGSLDLANQRMSTYLTTGEWKPIPGDTASPAGTQPAPPADVQSRAVQQWTGQFNTAIGQIPKTDPNAAKLQNQFDAAIKTGDPKQILPVVAQATNAAQAADASAKAQTAQADATRAQLETAPPSPDAVSSFIGKILPSYTDMDANEQAGYASLAKQARTVGELDAVQNKALASQQSRAQAKAQRDFNRNQMDTKFQEAGLTENEKDNLNGPHGYLSAQQQVAQTLNSIQEGADGNALITNLVPTMEVLGVNHAAGISRISPEEARRAGTSPQWAQAWNNWVDAATKGKLNAVQAQQGRQLMNTVLDAAYQKYLSASQVTARGHKIDVDSMPAVLKDGTNTTLDVALRASKLSGVSRGPNGDVIGWDGYKWIDATTGQPWTSGQK